MREGIRSWTRGVLASLVAGLSLTCVSRPVDVDLTEEVERVCTMLCEQNVACHEPPLFETVDECLDSCLDSESLYAAEGCGAARRAVYECIGETTTCEEYLDTNNVHAEAYTCKAEKDAQIDACLP